MTCKLKQDINENVVIDSDNITLDCAGHHIVNAALQTGRAGINFGGTTGVTIEKCTVRDFENGIFGIPVSEATLAENTVIGNIFHPDIEEGEGIGIRNSTNVTLEKNTVVDSDFGLRITGSTAVTVIGNNLCGNSRGIGFFSSTDSTLERNTVCRSFGDGIDVRDSQRNDITRNIVTGSGGVGIALGSGFSPSTDNTLTDNVVNGNGEFGFSDDSSGSGTAGTDNTYLNNICNGNVSGGSDPPGLCSPQT